MATSAARTGRHQAPRHALRLLIAAVAFELVVVDLVGDRGVLGLMKARRDWKTLNQQVATLHESNRVLREEARRLREDPSAIEDVARRDLGLIRPGELLFTIRAASSQQAETLSPQLSRRAVAASPW